VDVPFTDAIRVLSRWRSGAKSLVAAMERRESVAPRQLSRVSVEIAVLVVLDSLGGAARPETIPTE